MKKLVTISLLFLSLSIAIVACNDNAGKTDNTAENKALKDSLEAIKVLDTVAHMPEVIDRKKLIEGNSQGQRKLSSWIVEKPGRHPFYLIAVEEDSGRTENALHFNFHVYPDSMRVLFYDILNEREIPLEEFVYSPEGQSYLLSNSIFVD
ncbi:MAG: hypothetical protein J7497_09885, partial [Chitinophagaceae bacterium]|nr:hypothetical protein [Chitinophagaceae bacterium]